MNLCREKTCEENINVGTCRKLVFKRLVQFSSVSSVAQLCPTAFDPMDCSTPGFHVHHQLPEFTQTHVHRASDAIQPFHPLLSPSLIDGF